MTLTKGIITCARFDNDENGESHDSLTFIEVDDFGDGIVGFHVSPYEDNVQTTSMTIEDGWRFVQQFTRALVQAEIDS